MEAVAKIDTKYRETIQKKALLLDIPEPLEALPDLATWLKNRSSPKKDPRMNHLRRRVLALQRDIEGYLMQREQDAKG